MPSPNSAFDKLADLGRKLEALEHAQSMLSVDEAVMMPIGGGEKRAESMAMLAGMYHEMATAPEIADWLAAATEEPLDEMQQAAIREQARTYTNMTCLTSDFVRRQVVARLRSEQLWRELRSKGDWAGFLPAFEGVVAIAREEAELRAKALGLDPYDAMMEQYDPGNRAADITPVFARLKTFLKDFVPEALAHQDAKRAARPLKPLNAPFPIDKQKALGLAVMEALGFDFEHGRLDVSHHPFMGGVPSDIRMTTRYQTSEFFSSLMGIIHETGHGLYEQGLPKEWSHWAVGKARGMAIHESQSLFVEKQIGRSPEFWEWVMPLIREHLGEASIAGWSIDDLLLHVHEVKTGLIRVDADEATYPLHVILRYEIEKGLIEGTIKPKDVPDEWHARMIEYLGLSTRDNYKDGPMQDVHWPSGAFGYFPSYTLGAMIAAQLWASLEKDHPTAREDMRLGRFVQINNWRRDKIWSQASRYSTPELLVKATGEKLNGKYFEDHLRRRYLA
ncbi:MAG: carboxypeptidase M32 [Devosia sp.]